MKHDYRMNWTLPALPLGPARPQVLPISDEAKVANSRYMFEEFEWPTAEGVEITDADCKQINGAARLGEVAHQSRDSESVGGDRPPHGVRGDVAAPPIKNGDIVRVLRCDCAEPPEFIGMFGVVYDLTEDVMGEGCLFYIDFGNREPWCWNASEVELA